MNQGPYYLAYKGRKIVVYPPTSLILCRFTLKSPAEIPVDARDWLGFGGIGTTGLTFISNGDDLWCLVTNADGRNIVPTVKVICHTHQAIDTLDNRHRPMYHSPIIAAWQNIKAHVWAFIQRRKNRETIYTKTHPRSRRRRSRILP